MVRSGRAQGLRDLPDNRKRTSANRWASEVPKLTPGPPSTVGSTLAAIRGLPGHAFWPDNISLIDCNLVDAALLSSHARVTDSYLLALARANKGQLATLDQKLATEVVADGRSALALI